MKVFRSDNAPELKFVDFFANTGTIQQFSCVERPQQNSVVEKKHQHLLNVSRALFFQSHISIRFWGDCVLTATFIVNIIPMPLLSNITHFTVLHNKDVDHTSMKFFGCLCYASTLTAQMNKFDPRATPCLFIGYPPGIKGYKLYDIKKRHY